MAFYTMDEYIKKNKKKNVPYAVMNDIGPVKETNVAETQTVKAAQPSDKKLQFVKNSVLYEDGYQFGDIIKNVGANFGKMAVDLLKGIGRLPEGVLDLAGYGVAGIADLIGADKFAEKVKNYANVSMIDSVWQCVEKALEPYHSMGRTLSATNEAIGQVVALGFVAKAAQMAGLSAKGVSAVTQGTMGASAYGSGIGEAYESGASDGEAWAYGAMTATSAVMTEMIFGGMGKAVDAIGFSKGLSSADDMLAQRLTSRINNLYLKNCAQFGIKAGAEGFEEVLDGFANAAAKKFTYMSKEDFWQLVKDENLLEQFVSSTFLSAAMQSGYIPGTTNGSLREANATGREFITGYTQNEQKLVDSITEKRIADVEQNGNTLTAKEKNEIKKEVQSELEKGRIDLEIIESVLGGEYYNNYKSVSEQETKLKEEIEKLENIPKEQITVKQSETLAELREKLKGLDKAGAKSTLSTEVDKLTVNDSFIRESYNERTRRGQAYKADLTKYDEKQRATIQKAMESGILNNTNRTHEFVDLLAQICADKGITFDFTNNERLKESGFALNGKTVNGYVQGGNITLNLNSAKALNSVVGHEITHVLEGSQFYSELQDAVFAYAKTKGEYDARLADITKLYKDVEDADINGELTADLVGDYLFTDEKFVRQLFQQNRNVFERMWNEIKYLCKTVTAGTKEAKQLLEVQKTFEKVWNEGESITDENVRYSLVGVDENNIEVYETSEDVKKLPYTERKKKLLEFMKKEYAGRTAKFIKNGQVYYAQYDESGLNKGVYGDNKSSKRGYKAKINIGADGNYIELAESALYKNSKSETGKPNRFHKDAKVWDYFIKTIKSDGKYFDVVINVKDTGTGHYVYDITLKEATSLPDSQGSYDGSSIASNNNISQNQKNATEKKQFSIAGPRALTSNSSLFLKAERMLDMGVDSETVRQETGWYKGYDGRLRFEIDDSKSKLIENPNLEKHEDEDSTYFTGKLSDILEHDELYEAYPQLRNVNIVIQQTEPGVQGIYQQSSNYITLSLDVFQRTTKAYSDYTNGWRDEIKRIEETPEYKEWNKWYEGELADESKVDAEKWLELEEEARNKFFSSELGKRYHQLKWGKYDGPIREFGWNKKSKAVLMHEVQHAIQKLEGFEGGSNPRYFERLIQDGYTIKNEQQKEDLRIVEEEYTAIEHDNPVFFIEMNELLDNTPTVPRGEVDWDTLEQIEEDPVEWQEFDQKRDALEEKYGTLEVFHFIDLHHKLGSLRSKSLTADQAYLNSAGEIEARDTENRLELDSEQRRNTRPDIDSEKVVLSDRYYSLSSDDKFDIAPPVGWNVKGSDIAFDDDLPIRDDLAQQPAPEVEEPMAAEVEEDTDDMTAEEIVNEKVANLQNELDMNRSLREQAAAAAEEKIAGYQAEYDAKKKKDTKAANALLRKIERAKRLAADSDREYAKRIEKLEGRIEKIKADPKGVIRAERRKIKNEQYASLMEELVGDTSTWVDKKFGISYKTNTLRRNLRDIVRDASGKRDIAKADAIYDELQGNYNRNEASLNRESNRIKEPYKALKITKEEDAYIQMLGELRHNPDTELTQKKVKGFYERNKDKIDVAKVDKIIEDARATYDELFNRVNAVLREQGMKEIPYRKGYFPHFKEEQSGFIGKLLNWKKVNNDIPTSIAGITETFKPNRSWQSFNKQRLSDDTDYSFTKGLDTYVHGALDWIYHIEDIQKRRALENYIRYTHSEEGVQDRIKEIQSDSVLTYDEAQAAIEQVLSESRNPLNNFVTDLRAGTNTLAGKKSSMDRTIEEAFNREFYSTMTNLYSRVTANQVAGSISSALTNFIPITQSWGQVSPKRSLQAMRDTIGAAFVDDGIVEKSDFLTNRLRKEEKLYKTNWDKVSEKATFLMEAIDSFTSQTVWRSKYIDNLANGMSESAAIKDADQFAENVIAGRSRGNMPTIFDSKNPLVKTLTAFQLEVSNQYGYMFKDMPQDMQNETKGKLIKGYATMFIGAYVYNALYSALTGRDSAFDPIGIVEDFLKDMGLFGDDDDEEEENPVEAIKGLGKNVTEELPFVGGMLGGGRIPISSALPYGEGVTEMFTESLSDIESGDYKNLTKEWLNPLYYMAMPLGGGQLRKTVQGLSMFDDDLPIAGSYTDSGNLRFPVEDTFGNKAKAALFGQYASKNAREYFDRGEAPLKEKQIEELKDLDLPIADYWDYRDGLKKQKTMADKFDYVAGLDVSTEQKNIMVNNIANRKEKIDMSNYDEFSDFEEFDFYLKNKDKYNFLKDNGVSYADYSKSDVAKEKYDSDYTWYKENPERVLVAQAVAGDVFKYRDYMRALDKITSDKNAKGQSISGSAKKKKAAYINKLDLDYGQKIILYRMCYKSDDTYNKDIVEYLDNRDDLKYNEVIEILKALNFTVKSDGTVKW